MIDKLAEESKAISLKQLAAFADALDKMPENLKKMNAITSELRVNASQLSDGK